MADDPPNYPSPNSSSGNLYNGAISDLQSLPGNFQNESALIPKPAHSTSIFNIDDPLPLESENCFKQFQATKLKYFPFVHFPPTVGAHQVRQEKPFLWLCIMAISLNSTAQHQILADKIKQIVAEQMVVQSEKSIDFLLGLLAFIGWYEKYTF